MSLFDVALAAVLVVVNCAIGMVIWPQIDLDDELYGWYRAAPHWLLQVVILEAWVVGLLIAITRRRTQ